MPMGSVLVYVCLPKNESSKKPTPVASSGNGWDKPMLCSQTDERNNIFISLRILETPLLILHHGTAICPL
jgi:hypothetical protein